MRGFCTGMLLLVLPACGRPAPESAPSPEATGVPVSADLDTVREAHEVSFSPDQWERITRMADVPALPEDPTNRVADDLAAAEFGHRLFFDPRLSGTGGVSCATCHDPALDFTDGLRVAEGVGLNRRNTPTVLNAAHQRWLTWDGRSDSLWAQALEPLENEVEMAGDRTSVVRLVAGDPVYRQRYESVFGPLPELGVIPDEMARPTRDGSSDEATRRWDALPESTRSMINEVFVNVGKSIGAYQRRLISADAPFDRFVESVASGRYQPVAGFGDAEVRGLGLFSGEAGCWECHAGPMITTGEFHNIGIPPMAGGMPTDSGRFAGATIVKQDPFNASGAFSDHTQGPRARLVRTLIETPENWGRFRTPSLREVSRTAPYMHEGRFDTLEDVVEFYSTLEGAVQLDHHQELVLEPLDLDDRERADLVAFLEALDGTPREPRFAQSPPAMANNGS
ncbi:MAG: cytochrome c peroxidase [Planctomycetota bacterium]|nr:cytochrome c peroxidase [Planctomycetota bacterium]